VVGPGARDTRVARVLHPYPRWRRGVCGRAGSRFRAVPGRPRRAPRPGSRAACLSSATRAASWTRPSSSSSSESIRITCRSSSRSPPSRSPSSPPGRMPPPIPRAGTAAGGRACLRLRLYRRRGSWPPGARPARRRSPHRGDRALVRAAPLHPQPERLRRARPSARRRRGAASRLRVAPGGIEPPRADSKSAALSTELRGRSAQASREPALAVIAMPPRAFCSSTTRTRSTGTSSASARSARIRTASASQKWPSLRKPIR
jgi:hypothetical protein